MRKFGKYFGQFALRGLIAMGFGPIVLAIIYAVLGLTGVAEIISVYEMCLGIITITALAFLCGGMTALYQIEELPISIAITAHGLILYVAYATVYLVNGWLKEGLVSFLVFTAIFVAGYLLVWLIIYFVTKRGTDIVNTRLKNRAD